MTLSTLIRNYLVEPNLLIAQLQPTNTHPAKSHLPNTSIAKSHQLTYVLPYPLIYLL